MSQQAASAKKETAKRQTKSSSRSKAAITTVSEPSLNMNELRELASLVNENGFTDFEFENANIRVRLSKNPAPQYFQSTPPQFAPAASNATALTPAQTAQTNAETQSNILTTEPAADAGLHIITAPIVGTFYRSPAPDKEPYVKEGSKVSPDTYVCIIEAMKLMNEIEAEVAGKIVKIYVENGQPVEFGQPLFGIEK